MILLNEVACFQTESNGSIDTLAFNPTGHFLVVGSQSGSLSVWRTRSWQECSRYWKDGVSFDNLQFVNNWTFYAIGPGIFYKCQGDKLHISSQLCETPGGMRKRISPNGKWVASLERIESAFGLPIDTEEPFLFLIENGENEISIRPGTIFEDSTYLNPYEMQFSPDSNNLAVVVEVFDDNCEYRLFVIRTDKWELTSSIAEATSQISPICFSPDSRFLACGHIEDCSIHIHKIASTPTYFTEFHGHTDNINCLSYHPNNRFLASGSKDQTMRMWSLDHHQATFIHNHDTNVTALAFNPVGSQLAMGDQRGHVKIFELSIDQD